MGELRPSQWPVEYLIVQRGRVGEPALVSRTEAGPGLSRILSAMEPLANKILGRLNDTEYSVCTDTVCSGDS